MVFKIASALRNSGFIAEIDLDGKSADWTLEVKNDGTLSLTNKAKSRRTEVRSVPEVIRFLEVQRAA